ncbi:hypothetical protein [Streptomyces sp. NPDC094031]|uniref:hypothetical protein n=1 Tax=Streptomyces sp. NPDC094031 TaxID=3155307 RepID=UPI003332A454
MTPGSAISFLGVDGSGKSTIARALCKELAAAGRKVRILSRRDYLRDQPQGHVADVNRALYDAGLRSLYSFARTDEGQVLGEWLPGPSEDLRASALEQKLNAARISANDPQAITAAALSEIAGSLVYYTSVVRPELDRGTVVIEETHPLKMVTKLCLIASQTASDEGHGRAAVTALRSATMVLAPDPFRDVPVLVRCDPQRAYDRLITARGGLGVLEHHGLAGRGTGREAYMDLMVRVQEAFEDVAQSWRCVVVDSDDEDQDRSVKRAVETILADPRTAHLA